MKLEDIMDQWKQDASIDNTDLGEESLQIPNLHAKYMEIYTKEKKTLRELKRVNGLLENEMRTIMSDHSNFNEVLKDMGKSGYGDNRQYGNYGGQ